MGLNIKNDAVHDAVRELAHRLGVSQTSAVEIAVRAKLDEVDSPARSSTRARAVQEAVDAAQRAYRGVDLRAVEADLYDEMTGMPR